MIFALAGLGWLDLLASLVLTGGRLYAALVGPPPASGGRALRSAAALLALVLPLALALTAYRLSAVSGVRGVSLFLDLLGTRWGTLWLARSAGLALLVACPRTRPRAGAVLAALWLLPRSFQGHGGAHGTVPALIDWLHLLAAAAWLGSLVQLALAADVPRRTALRMRTLATTSVAVLVPAGLYGAFLHVPHLRLLADSAYGRVLLAKLVGAGALLTLGAVNHFRHVPALLRDAPGAEVGLARTVRRELALGATVVLLSALLGVLPMPHAMPMP